MSTRNRAASALALAAPACFASPRKMYLSVASEAIPIAIRHCADARVMPSEHQGERLFRFVEPQGLLQMGDQLVWRNAVRCADLRPHLFQHRLTRTPSVYVGHSSPLPSMPVLRRSSADSRPKPVA